MTRPESHEFGGYAAAVSMLAKHGVEFVVCGGVASVFYGVPRSTLDLDVLVRMTDENLTKLIEAAQELELAPRIAEPMTALKDVRRREDWTKNKQAKVFTFQSPNSPLQIEYSSIIRSRLMKSLPMHGLRLLMICGFESVRSNI